MTAPIYSFVAFSNTGKTTLLEKLVIELKARGLRLAVIKHDAHDFDIDHEGKDSWRFTKAGADVTIVASAVKAAVIENRFVPIEELIERIRDVDLILTEGYKHGPWPKIALQRRENGKPLPVPPEECLAIVSDMPVDTKTPCLGFDEVGRLADLIEADMHRNHCC